MISECLESDHEKIKTFKDIASENLLKENFLKAVLRNLIFQKHCEEIVLGWKKIFECTYSISYIFMGLLTIQMIKLPFPI